MTRLEALFFKRTLKTHLKTWNETDVNGADLVDDLNTTVQIADEAIATLPLSANEIMKLVDALESFFDNVIRE